MKILNDEEELSEIVQLVGKVGNFFWREIEYKRRVCRVNKE